MTLVSANRWAGLAATLGGLLWVVLRPLIATTWNNPLLGLTYEDYNRLMVVPLLLLLLASRGLCARYAGRVQGWARRGLLAIVLGFALMLGGVVVEFHFAGGVNQGDWTGSLVGWLIFLLGYLGAAVGLILFGVRTQRATLLGAWSLLPLATGVAGLLWPFLAEVGFVANALPQVLYGLGWVGMGLVLWFGRGLQRPATHARAGPASPPPS